MTDHPHQCVAMVEVLRRPDFRVTYSDKFREYELSQIDPDAGSYMTLAYCPFCCERLPESVRRQWFDYFFERDLDPWTKDDIPPAMQTGQWWREAGL